MTAPDTLRIVYAGTPAFAVPPLERLLQGGYTPVAVLTQPDRPAGRGRRLQAGPVKQLAEHAGIPVRQPETLRDGAFVEWLGAQCADLLIVVAYGLIVPPEVLTRPRYGGWNIHASLLPRWRGAAPIQRAIEAGDPETGVCLMQMDAGLDTGDVLACRSTPIGPEETAAELHDRLAALGADLLLDSLQSLAGGSLPAPRPQPDTGITYARKLDKAEARIDWKEPAARIARRVRAFIPWPVAWTEIDGERTRIWAARAEPAPRADPPGTIVAADATGIRVATGDGLLALLRLQRPGGQAVSSAEYLNARAMTPRLAGTR